MGSQNSAGGEVLEVQPPSTDAIEPEAAGMGHAPGGRARGRRAGNRRCIEKTAAGKDCRCRRT